MKFGLVASLNKPSGNVTGVVSLGKILVPKQLELLHELAPKADVIAFLVNPNNAVAKADTSSVREAAQTKGLPPRRSASRFRRRCGCARMRSLNDRTQRRSGAGRLGPRMQDIDRPRYIQALSAPPHARRSRVDVESVPDVRGAKGVNRIGGHHRRRRHVG